MLHFINCKKIYRIDPFDELIISWNALRPKQGRYLILVQIERSEWIPYAEWGADYQQTFSYQDSFISSHQDVIQLSQLANQFCIKAEGLDSLYVCATQQSRFAIRSVGDLPSICLPFKTLRSQMNLDHSRKHHLCSPTSLSMAIDYLLSTAVTDPCELAEKVRDHRFDIYGNWVLNTAEVFGRLRGYHARVERLDDFSHLHRYLCQNLPVVVSVKGPLTGALLPYEQGHLMVVVGWNALSRRVICADPAHPTVLISYAIDDFLAAWARRRNLCYSFGISEGEDFFISR